MAQVVDPKELLKKFLAQFSHAEAANDPHVPAPTKRKQRHLINMLPLRLGSALNPERALKLCMPKKTERQGINAAVRETVQHNARARE